MKRKKERKRLVLNTETLNDLQLSVSSGVRGGSEPTVACTTGSDACPYSWQCESSGPTAICSNNGGGMACFTLQ